MAAAINTQAKKTEAIKLSAKFPPFHIIPTGQVVGAEPTPVEIDGWVQANIDAGWLIKCS